MGRCDSKLYQGGSGLRGEPLVSSGCCSASCSPAEASSTARILMYLYSETPDSAMKNPSELVPVGDSCRMTTAAAISSSSFAMAATLCHARE